MAAGALTVELPSGDEFTVMSQDEVDWVETTTARYVSQFAFENALDLNMLDRCVQSELLHWRVSRWCARGKDYDEHVVILEEWREFLVKTSQEIRQMQKALGVDKVTREKLRGDGSVHVYLAQLRERAGHFGVNRSNQLERALTLVMELRTLVTMHDNCTPDERARFKISPDTILEWIRTTLGPEYDEIDEHFRTHVQTMWVRDQ